MQNKSHNLRFWEWMAEREGWKALSGFVYLVICVFDFIIVPSWRGLTRPKIDMVLANVQSLDLQVQLELIKILTAQHEPFTLMGAGLFHLAFGALLTGSAIVGRKDIHD